jgi:hypothetical protein
MGTMSHKRFEASTLVFVQRMNLYRTSMTLGLCNLGRVADTRIVSGHHHVSEHVVGETACHNNVKNELGEVGTIL